MSDPSHHDLPQQVGDAVRAHALWAQGERVAVSVSGGVDSVVLLHALVRTAGWHRAQLSVVTIDHGTRPDSAADADFVEALAGALGVPCTRHTASLGTAASEQACRQLRRRVWSELPVDVVATAHHADDQAETVLLQLIRGAGTTGLAAMRHRVGRLARPMLGIERGPIVAWARREGLSWREDPSNASGDFLRNKLRHQVMPHLVALRPGAVRALARSARVAAVDDAFLEGLLPFQPVPGEPLDLPRLQELPEALLRRTLLRWAPGIGAVHVDAAVAVVRAGRGRVELPGGRVMHIETSTEGDMVRMVRINA